MKDTDNILEPNFYILKRDYTASELEAMSLEELDLLFLEVDEAMSKATSRINYLKLQSSDGYIDEVTYRKTKSFLATHNFAKVKIASIRKRKRQELAQSKTTTKPFSKYFHDAAKVLLDEEQYSLIFYKAKDLMKSAKPERHTHAQ